MEELGDILKRLATRNTSGGSPPQDGPEPAQDVDVCEECGGRGWYTADVPVGHAEFGKVVTCGCQQQRLDQERSGRLLRYSNLGYLSRFTFETLVPEGRGSDPESRSLFDMAYRAAMEYVDGPTGWLVFAGPHGLGKTHLAAAIGNRLIQGGRVVFFSHVPDLLDHLRATFNPSSEIAYSELFQQVRSTPLLILDGLGTHSTTPWAEEKLRQIIGHRFNAELPTIITTHVRLDDMDPYILSRLRTSELSRVFEMRSPARDSGPRLGRIEPTMMERMTFQSFDVRGNDPTDRQRLSLEAAYRAATDFAADPHGWLTLSGATGAGKTHLAVAIAVERMTKGETVFFAFVPELLDYLRETFSPDSAVTYDRLFDQVKAAPILILDDLGKERSSKWAVEKLYQIIVHRHNARLPTVITSMLEFKDELDPITSRVQDPWVGQLIRIDAPDYRNKGRRPRRARRAGSGTRTKQ